LTENKIRKQGTLTLKLKLNKDFSNLKSADLKRKKLRMSGDKFVEEETELNAKDILKKISDASNEEIKKRQQALQRISPEITIKSKKIFNRIRSPEQDNEQISKKEEEFKDDLLSEQLTTKKEPTKEKSISEIDVFDTLKEIVQKEKEKFQQKTIKKKNVEEEEIIEESFKNEETGKENSKKKVLMNKENFDKRKNKRHIHTYIISEEDELNTKRLKKGIKNLRQKRTISQATEHKKIITEVPLPEFITVSDLADRMNEKKAEVIKKLLLMGTPATANQTIEADTAEIIINEFGHKAKRIFENQAENLLHPNEGKEFIDKSPVVTIMGHVDHGKTSLLDAIRSTNILSGEAGGITQHIGASRIKTEDGKYITFIDTPGHEAFTEMRIRGANITDIVVLVVAADDGIQDQTIEAINHAKAAKAPIIVAINKIDKPNANPTKVKNELLNYGIVSEELGGDTIFVEVSAKQKINLDKLKEAILLQAEILELKAPIDVRAGGAVIDAKMNPQKGVIASLLVQRGILKTGDLILAGTSYGKIKKMTDDGGKNKKEALPSVPVEILGLNSVPKAGDQFYALEKEKEVRDIIFYRERKERETKISKRQNKTLENMLTNINGTKLKELAIIIKADVNGSIEAIANSLIKLNTNEVAINIVHSRTGAITESDINLASISNALIIGFNVRANNDAQNLAKDKHIEIRYYSIIYNIIDEIKAILSGMLEPIIKEEKIGTAEVKQVFKVSKVGNIAGSYVTEGSIERNANLRLIRDGIVIFDGKIKALKHLKDDVKEIKSGHECGIQIENYNDIKERDVIECYKTIEEKRSL
jgi:translation initiation factor IF-2